MKSLLISCFALSLAVATAEEGPTPAPEKSRPFIERLFGSKNENPKLRKLSTATPQPWIQHAPGRLPPGKAMNESEAAKLADGDYSSQTIYLTGIFDVTAAATKTAVLRSASSPPSSPPIRLVVEYPQTSAVPREGMKLKFDETSGLLLRSAIRAGDMLNLRARQIGKSES